jgi:mxaD protein
MTEITETAIIAADADTLWREAGGFGQVGDWHPLLDRVEVEGSGPGAVRRAYDKQGGCQLERLLASDAARRELRYTIEQTKLSVRNWEAFLRIEPVGSHMSRVLWTGSYQPTDTNDTAAGPIRAFLHKGLDGLKERYAAA